ncbi:MAG: transglutaminase domain-containing protein [Saprospiraceae bacterium]
MTKALTTTLLLLLCVNLCAQEKESTVAAVAMTSEDSAPYDVSAIPEGKLDIETLAEVLTADAETDREKAEAIYHWVANNIAYDVKLYEDFRSGERDKKGSKRIRKKDMPEHNAKKVKKTLRNKIGICEDYALVIKSLCDEAGLESKLVKGYIRIDPAKLRSTGEKHVWNLVKIDDEWLPIDATYAAGYLDKYNEFVFDYDENYFLADKKRFSINHLPRDTSHMLTDTIMLRSQFKNFPVIGLGYFDYKIDNFEPILATHELKKGDDFKVTFTSPRNIKQFTLYREKEDRTDMVKRIKKGDTYELVVSNRDVKTGRVILYGDKQLIAAYRLVIRR